MSIQNDDELRSILRDSRVIAVVGLSSNPDRPSNAVARYLMQHGYTVIPVNPAETEILGQRCYPDLASIPQKVDIVDCFRKPADIPPLARDAVAIGAKVLWLQLGVVNQEAAQIAAEGGLQVVMDRCTEIEHARLMR
jgi:predicted CoA-binding protein